ncbi:MAG: AAA family ATPase [Chitinophagaceae bacterium]
MKFQSIRLKDFRKFDNKEFSFDPQFNVLIGENGSGKTTILEALSVAINSYISVIEGRNVRPIRKEDIRRISFEYSIETKLETAVSVKAILENQRDWVWTVGRPYKDWGFMRSDDKPIKAIAKEYMAILSSDGGKEIILPLFNYLGSGRLWTESTERVKIFPKGSRLEGYHHCLSSKGTFKRFAEWFKTMELSSLQGDEISTGNSQVVKKAIANVVEQWDNIYYDVREDMLMAEKADNAKIKKLPFSYLSDGLRNIIGIVADIAYRCILLNPYLGHEATMSTPGVVLIDELDLHLHPNWQKTIVPKLKDTFPKIQFITTTHSPFIVQALKNEELVDMDGKDLAGDYYKRSIEDIAEAEMHVNNPQRSNKFLKMEEVAKKYYDLISSGKNSTDPEQVKKIKEQLDQLLLPFYDDPAYVAFLQSFKPQLDASSRKG